MGFLFQMCWKVTITGGNTLGVSLVKSNMYNIASTDFYKSVYYFFHPTMLILWVTSCFSIYVLRKFGDDPGKEIIKMSILLFSCGMLWFFIFPQHALHHSFLYIRMVIPSLALLSSAGMYTVFTQKMLLNKLVMISLFVLFVLLNCNETVFRNNFSSRYNLSRYRELSSLVDNTAVIYSNTRNVFPFSYYGNRTFRYLSSQEDLHVDMEQKRRIKSYLVLSGAKPVFLNPNLWIATASLERYLRLVDIIFNSNITSQLKNRVNKIMKRDLERYVFLQEMAEKNFIPIFSIPALGVSLYSLSKPD